jgi:hypothetical protein
VECEAEAPPVAACDVCARNGFPPPPAAVDAVGSIDTHTGTREEGGRE